MNYLETLKYFEALERVGIKLGLENIKKLLFLSGNPENELNFIHIAGTNGKGSTAAFMAEILKTSGYRVGLYTSPHLVRFEERISVNGKLISEERLAKLATYYRDLIEKEKDFSPTFFEVTTALAFKYFAEEKVKIGIMEVGMGGRLDATNVIKPEVAVITKLSQDHVQYLGQRLSDIAGEKFSIIKPGVAVVAGVDQKILKEKLKEICAGNKNPLTLLGENIEYRLIKSDLSGQEFEVKGERFKIKLLGLHQLDNAALAIAGVEILRERGYNITLAHLRGGLEKTDWPGRFEVAGTKPYIILDGAHNLEAVKKLKEALGYYFPKKGIVLVLGIMADKNWPLMVRILTPLARLVITGQVAGERACPSEKLGHEALRFTKEVIMCPSIREALAKAMERAGKDEVICVTGSLYVVGEAKQVLGEV